MREQLESLHRALEEKKNKTAFSDSVFSTTTEKPCRGGVPLTSAYEYISPRTAE